MGVYKDQKNIPTLDLHGFRVDEVFDAVEKFLRKLESQSATRARILPGKGSGKIKAEVLRYLKMSHYPSSAEKDGAGRINEGSLIVFLD